MKTILTYALIGVGALLTFIGFIAVLALAYLFLGVAAALAALVGLVGLAGAWLMVEEGPAEDNEPVDHFAAPEGAPNVVELRR